MVELHICMISRGSVFPSYFAYGNNLSNLHPPTHTHTQTLPTIQVSHTYISHRDDETYRRQRLMFISNFARINSAYGCVHCIQQRMHDTTCLCLAVVQRNKSVMLLLLVLLYWRPSRAYICMYMHADRCDIYSYTLRCQTMPDEIRGWAMRMKHVPGNCANRAQWICIGGQCMQPVLNNNVCVWFIAHTWFCRKFN